MSKLQNPFGNGKRVLVTQTYHAGGNNIAIDCITDGTNSSTPIYAMSNGKVTMISNGAGSYLCKTINGVAFQEFYVHTARWVVSTGQYVKTGDLLGYIATQAENGGYPMHLHIGLSTGNYIMNYFDRNIDFRTTYQDIANDWFNGSTKNPINWSLFQDLSLDDNHMFAKGDRIIFTGEQNIRVGSGLQYDIESSTYAGMKATIIENSRIADGYVWYDVQIDGGGTGWVADVDKFRKMTNEDNNNSSNNDSISNPMDDVQSLKQEIKELKDSLRGAIAQGELDHALYEEYKEANESLAEDNKALEKELKEVQEKYSKEIANNERLEKEIEELDNTIADKYQEIDKYKEELKEAKKTILDLQEEVSNGKVLADLSTTELLREIVRRVFGGQNN